MNSKNITLGTTIHDETVEIVSTGRRYKVTIDGKRFGQYDCFEGCLVAAAMIVPAHRRTLAGASDWSF